MTINAPKTLARVIIGQTIVGADVCHDNSGPSLTLWFTDGSGVAIEAQEPYALNWTYATRPRDTEASHD